MIPGPAGLLEARLELPADPTRPIAVLCHPHPLYGGSMDDAVLDMARERFQAAGGGALAFNFRGVGQSTGAHDGGVGEVDDVHAVARWLGEEHGAEDIVVVGYSFGSAVAWRALERLGDARAPVLIAPPFGAMEYGHIEGATATVIAGAEDSFLDTAALHPWLAAQPGSKLIAVHGADHFFTGCHAELCVALDRAFAYTPPAATKT